MYGQTDWEKKAAEALKKAKKAAESMKKKESSGLLLPIIIGFAWILWEKK
jgi:hypothetical protein